MSDKRAPKRATTSNRAKPGGVLDEDEEALWQAYSERLTPVRVKGRITRGGHGVRPATPAAKPHPEPPAHALHRPAPSHDPPPHPLPPKPTPKRQPQVLRPHGPVAAHPPGTATAVPKRTAPPSPSVDPREAKRLAKGRLEFDAIVDLHGMTQAEAHRELRGFIQRSVARGCRHVLVITGKGRPGGEQGHGHGLDRSERGVLRRNVPRWLGEADLAPYVVGFAAAHARHGGDGALYVRLRRR